MATSAPGGKGRSRQAVRQDGGAGVALAQILLQALQADGLQVSRYLWLQAAGRHWLGGAHLLHRVMLGRALEWRTTREAFVEDGAQRVDVRRRPHLLGPEHLHPLRTARGRVTLSGMLPDAERLRLLHGPYTAPPLKRGDRTFCHLRDAEVLITGWSDTPSPGRAAVRWAATGGKDDCGIHLGDLPSVCHVRS